MDSGAAESGPPWPDHEWNEIIPGLWQGGHVYRVNGLPFHTDLTGQGFEFVVSLHTESWMTKSVPGPEAEHLVYEIPDGPVFADDEETLHDLAEQVNAAVDLGMKTLVRCQAGYNRSGLIVAMALIKRGYQPADAIALLREKRSSWALCNPRFVDYLLQMEPGNADVAS